MVATLNSGRTLFITWISGKSIILTLILVPSAQLHVQLTKYTHSTFKATQMLHYIGYVCNQLTEIHEYVQVYTLATCTGD